jgi:hypothetical protein
MMTVQQEEEKVRKLKDLPSRNDEDPDKDSLGVSLRRWQGQ